MVHNELLRKGANILSRDDKYDCLLFDIGGVLVEHNSATPMPSVFTKGGASIWRHCMSMP